jgi:hypothetical protein
LFRRANATSSADIENGRTLEGRAPGAAEVAFLLGTVKLGANAFGNAEHNPFAGAGELVAELSLGSWQSTTQAFGNPEELDGDAVGIEALEGEDFIAFRVR